MTIKTQEDALDIKTMTEQEIVEALQADTPINKARMAFSGFCARFERESSRIDDNRRDTLSPVEWRRLEFEAVQKIFEAAGFHLPMKKPPVKGCIKPGYKQDEKTGEVVIDENGPLFTAKLINKNLKKLKI